jgi:hypothetical protein
MADRFPQFKPMLEIWEAGDRITVLGLHGRPFFPKNRCWGELTSVWVDFVRSMLKVLAHHPDFVEEAERAVEPWSPDYLERGSIGHPSPKTSLLHDFQSFLGKTLGLQWLVPASNSTWRYRPVALAAACPNLWAIPDLTASTRLGELAQPDPQCAPQETWAIADRYLRRHSAASVAIRFLESVPQAAQAQIRHMVLLEDQPSIANSPSHAQGLLPFCRSNPQLYIQRVVDVWKVGLSPPTRNPVSPLFAGSVGLSLGRWILEASRLQELGMPDGSFQLVLHIDARLSDKTSEAFRAMAHFTSLHKALDVCYDRGILPRPGLLNSVRTFDSHYEDLYAALEKLQSGRFGSLLHCDFDFGNLLDDPDRLIRERSGWSHEEWKREWTDYMMEEVLDLFEYVAIHPFCEYIHLRAVTAHANSDQRSPIGEALGGNSLPTHASLWHPVKDAAEARLVHGVSRIQ